MPKKSFFFGKRRKLFHVFYVLIFIYVYVYARLLLFSIFFPIFVLNLQKIILKINNILSKNIMRKKRVPTCWCHNATFYLEKFQFSECFLLLSLFMAVWKWNTSRLVVLENLCSREVLGLNELIEILVQCLGSYFCDENMSN